MSRVWFILVTFKDFVKQKSKSKAIVEKKDGEVVDGRKLHGALKAVSEKNSEMLKSMRTCNECPLGAKVRKILVNGKEKEFLIPAKCPHFEKDKKTCPIDVTQYKGVINSYIELERANWTDEDMAKMIFHDAVSDMTKARLVEEATKGFPGFYTKEHRKDALEAIKIISGSKQHDAVSEAKSDLAAQTIAAIFSSQDEKKVVDAEIVEEDEEEKEDGKR